MIVGTHFGLFMPALRPDWQTLEDGQPELQIRSRRRVDLVNLRKFMQDANLELGEPFAIKNTDYQWRAYCTREAWGLALLQIAQDIDYTKFKDTPQKYHGDRKLTDAYSKIWSATLNAFPTGSIYDHKSSYRGRPSRQLLGTIDETRVAETVYRTETREWRMKGASDKELAELMRDIDHVSDGVELPSDEEINEMLNVEVNTHFRAPTEVNGHLDHTWCAHNSSAGARRKCRKRFYGRS